MITDSGKGMGKYKATTTKKVTLAFVFMKIFVLLVCGGNLHPSSWPARKPQRLLLQKENTKLATQCTHTAVQ